MAGIWTLCCHSDWTFFFMEHDILFNFFMVEPQIIPKFALYSFHYRSYHRKIRIKLLMNYRVIFFDWFYLARFYNTLLLSPSVYFHIYNYFEHNYSSQLSSRSSLSNKYCISRPWLVDKKFRNIFRSLTWYCCSLSASKHAV
jgi:hypothetical protein